MNFFNSHKTFSIYLQTIINRNVQFDKPAFVMIDQHRAPRIARKQKRLSYHKIFQRGKKKTH